MGKNKKFRNWMLSFSAIGGLIGMLIGQFMTGGFNLSGFLGALTAAVILISIDIIRNWRKKDSTPEFDERTKRNVLTFYAYASNVFVLIALAVLSFLSFQGIEQVSLTYLLIAFFAYFSLSGTAALVISRK